MRVFIENISQARRELAKVYRDYKAGKIESENARTKVYILRAVIESCWKFEIESELEKIKERLDNDFK